MLQARYWLRTRCDRRWGACASKGTGVLVEQGGRRTLIAQTRSTSHETHCRDGAGVVQLGCLRSKLV